MADTGEILIVIPARGGSKRLPRKNVLPLAGKPLICWTIEAAIKAKLNALILVSSDDDEILSITREYEADGVMAYKRPDELATDTASTVDVIKDACNYLISKGFNPMTVVLLQPTSPLRGSQDIKSAIDLYIQKNTKDTIVSVCEIEHPTAWCGVLSEDSLLTGIDFSGRRSQDYTKEYRLNGAIYISDYEHINTLGTFYTSKVYAHIMNREKSIDIDDKFDFYLAGLVAESIFNND